MDIDLLIKLAIVIVFLAVGLAQWIRHRLAQARGEKIEEPPSGEPAPEEPKLPYEDVIDQVFGPYMRRRRQEHEAARAREREEAAVEAVEEPPPRRLAAEEKPPAPPPAAPAAAPAPAHAARSEAPPEPEPVSLEDRLFRNPGLGAGAKLVLAAEILGRPKALRRTRPV